MLFTMNGDELEILFINKVKVSIVGVEQEIVVHDCALRVILEHHKSSARGFDPHKLGLSNGSKSVSHF